MRAFWSKADLEEEFSQLLLDFFIPPLLVVRLVHPINAANQLFHSKRVRNCNLIPQDLFLGLELAFLSRNDDQGGLSE